MTKYQEIAHLNYVTEFLAKIPTDIPSYTLYTYFMEQKKHIEKSLTVKEKFNHLSCKCKCNI